MTGMTRCPSGHRLDDQDPVPPLTASHVGLNIPTDVAMSMVRIAAAHHVSVSTTVAVVLPRWMGGIAVQGPDSLQAQMPLSKPAPMREVALNSRASLTCRESPEQLRQSGEIDYMKLTVKLQVSKRPSLAYDLGDLSMVGLIDISQHRENPLSQLSSMAHRPSAHPHDSHPHTPWSRPRSSLLQQFGPPPLGTIPPFADVME